MVVLFSFLTTGYVNQGFFVTKTQNLFTFVMLTRDLISWWSNAAMSDKSQVLMCVLRYILCIIIRFLLFLAQALTLYCFQAHLNQNDAVFVPEENTFGSRAQVNLKVCVHLFFKSVSCVWAAVMAQSSFSLPTAERDMPRALWYSRQTNRNDQRTEFFHYSGILCFVCCVSPPYTSWFFSSLPLSFL